MVWRLCVVVFALSACNEPGPGWTWTFLDPITKTDVGCPAGVDVIEISTWELQHPKHACADVRRAYKRQTVSTFPCDVGSGGFATEGALTRVDAVMRDGRIYARSEGLFEDGMNHVDIEADRGFLRIGWTFTTTNTCDSVPLPKVIDVDVLGATDHIECSSTSMAYLPGMKPGTYDFDVKLELAYEQCGMVFDSQVVDGAVVIAGETTDVMVTFTPH